MKVLGYIIGILLVLGISFGIATGFAGLICWTFGLMLSLHICVGCWIIQCLVWVLLRLTLPGE